MAITIYQLFNFLCADVKKLITIDLNIEYLQSSSTHFSSNKAKDQEKYFIKISKDAGSYKITSLEELMEYVLIFGHELTHCINKHNSYNPEDNNEFIATEMHADFQGARIATALYTYGYNLQKIIFNVFKYPIKKKKKKQEYCTLISKSISKLYKDYFIDNESFRYPKKLTRLSLCVGGIASFFYRSPQFQQEIGEYALLNILITKNLDEDILNHFSNTFHESLDLINVVQSVHRKIQGTKLYITNIKNPHLENIFGTSYHQNIYSKNIQKEQMRVEILTVLEKHQLEFLITEELKK